MLTDLRFLTAHHPGDRQRPGRIANKNAEIVQLTFDIIQGRQALPLPGTPGDDGWGSAAQPASPAHRNQRHAAARPTSSMA